MGLHPLLVQVRGDFIQADSVRWSGQAVPALGSPLRLHKSGFIQDPHQLAGIGHRDSFQRSNLGNRQRLALRFRARQLQKAAQTIFFLSRYLHMSCSIWGQSNQSLLLSQLYVSGCRSTGWVALLQLKSEVEVYVTGQAGRTVFREAGVEKPLTRSILCDSPQQDMAF